MVSSSFLPVSPDVDPPSAPNLLVGAASPLWAVFGGAAAAGAAWWWWSSRWREAINLEALMALAPEPVSRGLRDQADRGLVETPDALIQDAAAAAEPLIDAVAEQTEDIVQASAAPPAALAEAAVAVVEDGPGTAEASLEPVKAATKDAAETSVQAAEAIADDLTALVGIGPKLAASLADLGVTRFSHIAAWSADELDSFDKLLNLKGRAEREAWVAQARRLAQG